MPNVDEIKKEIEKIAPPSYAADWDNSGFQVNLHNDTEDVLICLDVTEEIIEEARERDCGLIISHHPLLFRGVKRVDSKSYHGGCIARLAAYGISLYSAHTSADSAPGGINMYLAGQLGLKNVRFLSPELRERFYKVAVAVPVENADDIRAALIAAGAGRLGNYSGCSLSLDGMGSFMPDEAANPHIGSANVQEFVEETWIQALVPEGKLASVLAGLRSAHPYEEPAIDVFCLNGPEVVKSGAGVIGELENAVSAGVFLQSLKAAIKTDSLRFSGDIDALVQKIALCGGAGSDFISDAERESADIYITGEIKHNQYYETGMALCEAGHFDTESCFVRMMSEGLQNAANTVQYKLNVKISDTMRRPFVNV